MREQRLYEFDFQPGPVVKPVPKDPVQELLNAMKFDVGCMGNLEISLYWEEKIVLFFRILQLYGFLFLVYYENWPTRTRLDITPLFTSSTMSWHILN
jgi:hypothetical protein